MREKGFITYFGLENCDNAFPRKLGRMPNVDYATSQFYCATYAYSGYTSSTTRSKQRCIGPHMSHYYVFNYTKTLNKMYKGLNQWLYVHVNAAHEATGLHAQTLDSDLKLFLKEFLHQNKENEVVVFLGGDHGMRYGEWFSNVEAFQENRLPAFFLISSRSLLDRIEYSYDVLEHNTLRLNSKLDMRKALIYLSGVPYDLKLESKELHQASNLFTQKIPNNTTCTDIGIPPWHCGCLALTSIPRLVYDPNDKNYQYSELGWLLHYLANEALRYFNSQVHSPKTTKPFLCKKLSLRSISAAYGLQLDNNLEEIKLELLVKESFSARFEVTFLMTSADDFMGQNYGYPVNSLVYNSYYKLWRIINILRLDPYKGKCENMAMELQLNPEFCICNDDDYIRSQNEAFLEKFYQKYSN